MSAYDQKLADVQRLRNQTANIARIVDEKERDVRYRESISRQEQVPTTDAYSLEKNLATRLGPLAPGNTGDINKVIWPYYFTTEDMLATEIPLAFNETFQTAFSITQEAAFVMMAWMKTVCLTQADPTLQWRVLNPNDETSLLDSAPGLQFVFRDASSSRQYNNLPANIAAYGNPRFPTKLPRPIILLPNQVMQVQFTNTHPTNTYIPKMTAFGYRIRIEDAQQILGLVYA